MAMRTISIDPGDNTGWAVWDDGKLVDSGQDPLWDVIDAVAYTALGGGLVDDPDQFIRPDRHLTEAFLGWGKLVVEDWALYPWAMQNHGMDWDACRTPRGIGAFELICRLSGREIVHQAASIKDSAEAAGAETLFVTPLHDNRHQNDAMRHGVFYFARQSPDYAPSTYDQQQAEGREADRG